MSKARIQTPMMEWQDLSWRKLERRVFKLRSSHIQSLSSRGCQGSTATSENIDAVMVSQVFGGETGDSR